MGKFIKISILIVTCSLNLNSDPLNVYNIKLSKYRYISTDGGNLRLREEPNLQSNILNSISNREQVEYLRSDDKEIVISNIKGYWAYIEYKEKKGWVFDGYLSKIYEFSPNYGENSNLCNSENLYLNKFKRIGKRKYFKANDNDSETKKYEDHYESKVISKTTIYLGGAYSTTEFPGKKIKEVFELYKNCDPKLYFVDYEEKNNKLEINFETEYHSSESYRFEFKDNKTIVVDGGQT